MSVTACKNWRKSVSLLLTALSISHVNRMQTLSRTFLLQSFTERLQKVCGSTSIHSKKVKVKYVDLYSASSRSASNALPLPGKSALISASQPYSQANTARPCDTGWCITWYACLLPQLHQVLIPAQAGSGWVGLGADSAPPRSFTRPKTVTHLGTNRA